MALAWALPEPEQSGFVIIPPPGTLVLDRVTRLLAGRAVVSRLALTVARGEAVGLLGINGAGKTTTLRMMAGVLAPSEGHVRLGGIDLYEQPALGRRRIGYLPETPPLHPELTADEYLAFCVRLHGVARSAVRVAVDRAVERCELGEVRRRPMATLSKGFRQRVGIAQAIAHEPELIVLDEPASGLDPVQAMKLRELVRGLGRDHAVVLSTHVLPDVLACCDRVAILHRGELRHVGPLSSTLAGGLLRVGVGRALREDDWLALPEVAAVEPVDAHGWRVRLKPEVAVGAFAAAVVERGFELTELRAERAALEQVFLAIAMGESPAAAA